MEAVLIGVATYLATCGLIGGIPLILLGAGRVVDAMMARRFRLVGRRITGTLMAPAVFAGEQWVFLWGYVIGATRDTYPELEEPPALLRLADPPPLTGTLL